VGKVYKEHEKKFPVVAKFPPCFLLTFSIFTISCCTADS